MAHTFVLRYIAIPLWVVCGQQDLVMIGDSNINSTTALNNSEIFDKNAVTMPGKLYRGSNGTSDFGCVTTEATEIQNLDSLESEMVEEAAVTISDELWRESNETDDITTKRPGQPSPPRGVLSSKQLLLGEKICEYLIYPLFVCALTVNIFNVIVYTDRSMKSASSAYLTAIAINEMIYAVLSMIRPILKGIYGANSVRRLVYLIFAMYNSNCVLAASRRLMYCQSVLVSLERFIAIAFPLKAKQFRLIKSPMMFIVSCSVFVLLCHLPGAFKFDIIQKANSTDYTIKPTVFYNNNRDFFSNWSIFLKIFYTYFILTLGLVTNISVFVALKVHNKRRQTMQTSVCAQKAARLERQTSIAILASTLLFTLLGLPTTTDSMVSTFVPEYNLYKKEHNAFMLMKDVNSVMVMLSLSTDFIFYAILSMKFRKTFARKISCSAGICGQKMSRDSSSSAGESGTKLSTLSETCADQMK